MSLRRSLMPAASLAVDTTRQPPAALLARMPLLVTSAISLMLGAVSPAMPGTWTEQESNSPHSLLVVHAVSNEVAWSVGDDGQVVVTVDGGLNWMSRPVTGADHLRALFAFDGETSVVADQTGAFWRTTDGGLNWVQVHAGAGRSINGIHFFDAANGWAVGDPIADSFVILESTDGGLSWASSPNAPPTGPLTTGINRSYDWVGIEIGIFSTTRWLVWRTTNAGALWDSVRTDIQFISGVELSDTGIGLASGHTEPGVPLLERSTDFGQTWGPGQHPSPTSQSLRNYDWIEGTSEVWAVTSQQGIYQSTTAGQDWIRHVLADPGQWIAGDLDFVDTSSGWCVGTRSPGFGPGRIFKYTSTTGITVASAVPSRVGIRAYPNPFASGVAFELDEGRHGPVEISIYDVSGRRLRTLVSTTPGMGMDQQCWDGRDQHGREVASGIYLYRVATMEMTGRLVKVR